MRYIPVLKNNDSIQLGLYNIDVRMIRCVSNAAEIILYWKQLEKQGFLLDDITSTLTTLEAMQYIKHKEHSVLPFPIHIIRLIDAIRICASVKGFEKRKNNLKERLSRIVKDNRIFSAKADRTIDFIPYRKYIDDLMTAILSSISEFRIAHALRALDSSLEFTTQKDTKYPDLKIRNYNDTITEATSLAEVKARLNRSYIGKEIQTILSNDKIIQVDKKGLIRLLCRDAFTTIENAFDKQKADIVIVDLSHSEYGDIFAAYSMHSDERLDLGSAFEDALQLANKQQKAAILSTEVFSLIPEDNQGIAAVTVNRDYAEDMGKRLDKREKDYYNQNGVHLHYFELINEAQKMKYEVN